MFIYVLRVCAFDFHCTFLSLYKNLFGGTTNTILSYFAVRTVCLDIFERYGFVFQKICTMEAGIEIPEWFFLSACVVAITLLVYVHCTMYDYVCMTLVWLKLLFCRNNQIKTLYDGLTKCN